MKPRVSLVKGTDRYHNVRQALNLIADDIHVSDKRRVLVKPNFTSTQRQLAATHVDAVRATLDFLCERGAKEFVLGEASGIFDSNEGFANFGYAQLQERYDIRFVDLNRDEPVMVQGFDRELRPIQLRVARTALESDFLVSVTPPKTHDCVIVTAALKNVLVGCLISDIGADPRPVAGAVRKLVRLVPRSVKTWAPLQGLKNAVASQVVGNASSKFAIHQDIHGINLNLYLLAKRLLPHLAVIDGFDAMEGAGPLDGDPVDLRVAIASADSVAADSLAAHLMGFDAFEIGYLSYCARKGLGINDLSQIEVIGEDPATCRRTFEPHPLYELQRNWRHPRVESLL
ncbi:MAG: DUF362 domain-containing protein [Chloroflexi bacterium]|nr:DUF362 domain-containing protein [Chloroflexota bacterium]